MLQGIKHQTIFIANATGMLVFAICHRKHESLFLFFLIEKDQGTPVNECPRQSSIHRYHRYVGHVESD